jgi:hypothetical protein
VFLDTRLLYFDGNKAGTILQLTSSQNPSAVNQAVTFTAVVADRK